MQPHIIMLSARCEVARGLCPGAQSCPQHSQMVVAPRLTM